jgi:hypothetical protein
VYYGVHRQDRYGTTEKQNNLWNWFTSNQPPMR